MGVFGFEVVPAEIGCDNMSVFNTVNENSLTGNTIYPIQIVFGFKQRLKPSCAVRASRITHCKLLSDWPCQLQWCATAIQISM